jgi:hypothetical protein
VLAAGKIEKLADDLVHFGDVVDHSLFHRLIVYAHLQTEAQTRERRAQVVRDAGQQQRAVVLQLPQIGDHLIEAPIEFRDLRRTTFRQRRRRFAATHACYRGIELAKRTGQITCEHERRDEQRCGEREAPDQRARRNFFRLRPRWQRKTDPISGATGFDADGEQLLTRCDSQFGSRP